MTRAVHLTEAQKDKKLVLTAMYVTPELLIKLKKLSKRTTVPVGTMARNALLEKYSRELEELEAENGRVPT